MFASKKHNHKHCVSRLETRISRLVSSDAFKLNENEKRVIKVLMGSHRALGAYEIADKASDKSKRLQPNQVYRAIDKLIEMGLAHKVKSEGGYIACHSGNDCVAPVLMICASCHQVAETENNDVNGAIKQSVELTGFVLQQQNVELTGLCPDCS